MGSVVFWLPGCCADSERGAEPLPCSLPPLQDVDAAYMGRMDLHGKVGTLSEELDFLNHLYDLVRWPMDRDNRRQHWGFPWRSALNSPVQFS